MQKQPLNKNNAATRFSTLRKDKKFVTTKQLYDLNKFNKKGRVSTPSLFIVPCKLISNLIHFVHDIVCT